MSMTIERTFVLDTGDHGKKTRQLFYKPDSTKSIDLVISLNGLPIVTIELKNPITGQTADHAKRQYQKDRDPRDPIFEFKRRTLVHFAADTDVVFMTTRLAGTATYFLPFNKGDNGGAGNPADPAGRGYRTAYLWEEALERDSLLDLLARFLHLQVEEKRSEDGTKVRRETMIYRSMAKRSHQANLSFFAFTATPKHKTLKVFGRKGEPFHRYTMRQAIEEGFILDVLKNYVTYATYFRLLKECGDDPNVERKKAARALSKYLRLHPHNISQKTEIMVEHFQSVTRHKIGGRAKAMVVTGSRLEAVRYKQAFDKYIRSRGYPIRTLVAFSGTVEDDKVKGVSYTEEKMNDGIREKELPEQFATADYQVLLVAEKYQTGFDQPLLHTMFIDRRLAGIQAVQTLSRLNRTHPLKEDTFILDFVPENREEVRAAFATYFEGATMGEEVDPATLYAIKADLDASGIYLDEEVMRFAAIYFMPKQRQSQADHQAMNAALDPAVSRFKARQGDAAEEMEEWRGKLNSFKNLYAFLSQVIPYQDSDLERLYVYLRHLVAKLPRRPTGPSYDFDDDVRLDYYRLQKISEGSISLSAADRQPLDGPSEVGSGQAKSEHVPLSRLIDVVNDRFGTDFTQADQLFFDQIVEAALTDDALRRAAGVNPGDKFELVFKNLLETLFVERMDQNEEIFAKFMNDQGFQSVVTGWLSGEAYRRLRDEGGKDERLGGE